MWVALKPQSGIRIEQIKEELRGRLAKAMPDVQFSFEPADIVNQVMSFGSSTPVEAGRESGPELQSNAAVSRPNFRRSWRRYRACATCTSCSRWTIRFFKWTSIAARPGLFT